MDFDEDNEDEEISIDFSKIKNIFGKKKKTSEETKSQSEEPQKKPEETQEKAEEEKPEEENKSEEQPKTEETKKEEETEDEDINIDFSKIKNIFKLSKKGLQNSENFEKRKEGTESQEEKEEDEEISFDFGKVKSFFKGLKQGIKDNRSEKSEEDVPIDIRKTMNFFSKNKRILLPTLLIIIAIFFCIQTRIQPANLPTTEDWARNSVHSQIESSIRSQINQQYPNLPDANKASLVDAELKKALKEQKSMIDQQVEATSNYFKTRLQNEDGQTYLLAIDPYFWMRHAKNVLENGHVGDELRNGRPYDTYMLAPVGRNIPPDVFHAYFEAYLYRFVRFFNRDLGLMSLVFYVPILLSALCIFPAFFIGRRLGGNFGGFASAFIIAVHPAFLTRTAGGFADTDAYNVLFPLLITWLFLEAFETQNKRGIITYSALAGLFVGLFSLSWGGWFYIFDFIIASSIAYLVFFIILNKNEFKNIAQFIKKPAFYNALTTTSIFIVSAAIFTSIFTNFNTFKDAFFVGPLEFARLKQVAITTIWPNVFTTVAEQNPASLDSVISQIGVGSILLFLIGITGIALTMLKKETRDRSDLWFVIGSVLWFMLILGIKPQNLTLFLGLISLPIIIKLILIIKNRDSKVDIKAAILLILWFTSTIYASVKGVRFTLLAVPVFAIAVGVTLGISYSYIHRLIAKGLKINKNVSKILVIILLSLLLFGPYRSGKATARNEIPSMNDAWYNSLQKIDFEAEPDAIINSWWDFGHWFKAIGNRAVTFDGTSQNSPNAHWIGSTLLTKDEDYAVGVLRMVDCGQNKAFQELDKVIEDGAKSMEILHEIVRYDKKKAGSVLSEKGLSEEETEKVLEFTHCIPPENYFITSYDMIGKAGVWAHFGSWNFDRSLIYNTLNKKEYKNDQEKSIEFLQSRFNYTETIAENVYYDVQSIQNDAEANSWIAPWPSYAGGSGCGKAEENKIACSIGEGGLVEIDLTTLQADIQTAQGIKHPDSVVLPLEDGSYRRREFNDTIGISMLLIPSGNENYNALMMHPRLDKSMFTIMFYLNGHGLKHFEKFSDVTDITGGRIIIWKVDWEGNSTNLFEYYEPEPVPEETEEIIEEEITEEPENEPSETSSEEETIEETNNSQDINTLDNSSE